MYNFILNMFYIKLKNRKMTQSKNLKHNIKLNLNSKLFFFLVKNTVDFKNYFSIHFHTNLDYSLY